MNAAALSLPYFIIQKRKLRRKDDSAKLFNKGDSVWCAEAVV